MVSDVIRYQNSIQSTSLKYGLIALHIDREILIFPSTLDYLLDKDLIATFPSLPDNDWDLESIENHIVKGCVLNGF